MKEEEIPLLSDDNTGAELYVKRFEKEIPNVVDVLKRPIPVYGREKQKQAFLEKLEASKSKTT